MQTGQTRRAGCSPSSTHSKCWSPLSLVAFPAISPSFCWLLPSHEKLTEIHHQYYVRLQSSVFLTAVTHWMDPGGSIPPLLLSHRHLQFSLHNCLYPSLGSSIHQPLKAGRPVVSSVQHLAKVWPTLCALLSAHRTPQAHIHTEPFHGTSHRPRLAGCAHHVS